MSQPEPIELAPRHKSGLLLKSPLMTTAGCYGLGTEYQGLVELDHLGAVVVGPVTLRRRAGADPPRAVPFPDGLLLHTGLANPGLSAISKKAKVWARSPVPVILHLAATTPAEIASACERLNQTLEVRAVELGLAPHASAGEAADLTAAAAECYAEGPLLVRLPLETAAALADPVVSAGANALTVAAPPRGTVIAQGQTVSGRLYGRFVLPLALRALIQVSNRVKVPLIGCGGIYSAEDARAFLRLGAVAVQIDALLWQDPSGVARIARELQEHQTSEI